MVVPQITNKRAVALMAIESSLEIYGEVLLDIFNYLNVE
mgnify:CR=1 FL=1